MENISIETLEAIFTAIIYVMVFLFGITIGSFLNVCILRLPRGESLVTNNSHCMTCGTQIKRYDLIPLFSWLILKGKCRACGAKISPRYMLVEGLTGVLFVGVFARYDFMVWGLYPVMLCLFLCGLIVLCFQDIDNREMCVSVLVYTAAIAAATIAMSYIRTSGGRLLMLPEANLKSSLLGMISVSGVLLIFGFVLTPLFYILFVSEDHRELRGIKSNIRSTKEGSREYEKLVKRRDELSEKIKTEPAVFGFGMGDVVLMAAGGLMLGLKAVITAGAIGILLGAVYGIIRKYTAKQDDENANVFAFGPFLIIGLTVAAFVNGNLIDLYVNTFLTFE